MGGILLVFFPWRKIPYKIPVWHHWLDISRYYLPCLLPDISSNPTLVLLAGRFRLEDGRCVQAYMPQILSTFDVSKKAVRKKKSNSKKQHQIAHDDRKALTLQGKKTYPINKWHFWRWWCSELPFRWDMLIPWRVIFLFPFLFWPFSNLKKNLWLLCFGKVQTSLDFNLLLPAEFGQVSQIRTPKKCLQKEFHRTGGFPRSINNRNPGYYKLMVQKSQTTTWDVEHPVTNGIFYNINWWSPDVWTINSSSLLLQNCKPIAFCCCHESYFA